MGCDGSVRRSVDRLFAHLDSTRDANRNLPRRHAVDDDDDDDDEEEEEEEHDEEEEEEEGEEEE